MSCRKRKETRMCPCRPQYGDDPLPFNIMYFDIWHTKHNTRLIRLYHTKPNTRLIRLYHTKPNTRLIRLYIYIVHMIIRGKRVLLFVVQTSTFCSCFKQNSFVLHDVDQSFIILAITMETWHNLLGHFSSFTSFLQKINK